MNSPNAAPQTAPQSDSSPDTAQPRRQLRLLSYNIHRGIGRDGVYDLNRILAVVRANRPDLVTLQEVDNGISRSGYDDQARLIASSLDMDYCYGVTKNVEDGQYGVATFSRFPILASRSTDISANKRWEPRTVMRTDLDLGEGRRMHLFNVHLGLRTRERFRQQRMLLSRAILFDKGLHNPIAIMGDFNDRPLPVVHPQFRRHFRDAYHLAGTGRRSTFRFGPVKYSLDYIYVNRDLRPIRTFIVRDPLAQMASDHLPIVSDVRVTFSEKGESNPLPVSRRLGLKKFSPRRFLRESQLRNKKEGDRS